MTRPRIRMRRLVALTLATGLSLSPAVWAHGSARRAANGITFQNFTETPNAGIAYERTPTPPYLAALKQLREHSLITPVTLEDFITSPYSPHGQPGVVIFDYDKDGDLDIYVTNGPGTPNSLYANQLMETGHLGFIDVGIASGADAVWQDSRGACAGDIDNDGDQDLLVLGGDSPNVLFENLGNGQFRSINHSGVEGGNRSHVSCAMDDIDNDGLLEILVANSFDHKSLVACIVEPFKENQHNQLYRNLGNRSFRDVSATSGIENLTGFGPGNEGSAGITWAVGMVDLDRDGDLDLIFGDDQCAFVKAAYGGLDRGFIHLLINDGTGTFVDKPITNSPVASGSWMGLGFGDFNCDSHVDIFGSNFGDYHLSTEMLPFTLGDESSRWLLGNGDGTFNDPGVGAGIASVFGWGNAVYDFDNDGDQDIAYFGALHANFYATADNPGTLLYNNGCSANFTPNIQAFGRITAQGGAYTRRNVTGVAGGDLNGDGFPDLVTVSRYNVPAATPLVLGRESHGAIWDDIAFFVPTFAPAPGGVPGQLVWTGIEFENGTLGIEINSGNANKSVGVRLVGAVGLISGGSVNRDGVGAIISFTPRDGKTVLMPAHAGSSFGSQHDLEALFGLGSSNQGTVEVMWPGGVKNRLRNVKAGERITFPEIPCSYDATWESFQHYRTCVQEALDALANAAIISHEQKGRFLSSALDAFQNR